MNNKWLVDMADHNQMSINVPKIPLSVIGRITKVGKPDRRYINSILMYREYLENAAGVNSASLGKI